MNLVREILRRVEVEKGAYVKAPMEVEGYEQEEVDYHVIRMREAGLLEAAWSDTSGSEKIFRRIGPLTWKGHDFLDAIRDDTVWNKTQSKVKSAVGSTSLEVIKAVAEGFARSSLGL